MTGSEPADQPDKLLFTPGPLTTSPTVKQAMLRDLGSRDEAFVAVIQRVRDQLLKLAGVSKGDGYEAVLVPGSGTYALEAVASSTVPRDGKLLIAINGAYGRRMAQIAETHHIATVRVETPEHLPVDPAAIVRRLDADPAITHVATAHCETTTGLLNPVEKIGAAIHERNLVHIVDAMSSFGAIPLDLRRVGVGFLIASSNKCIQGVPGFSFVLCQRTALEACAGIARTVSLDLYDQWQGFERNGQFRFTPPTHAMLAFEQALRELDAEGGIAGRAARYARNHQVLLAGMAELGFRCYVQPEHQGPIITSFHYPGDGHFHFEEFYRRLSDRGFVIYPGKVSDAVCFRIGTIGQLLEADVRSLLVAIREVLAEMNVQVPAAPPH
jgi:2-aminoethylphosphonate-pyruvate transaminase